MLNIKKTISYSSFITLLLLNVACGGGNTETQFVCPPYVAIGISIQVYDKQTGFEMSCGASASIQENNYIEELVNPAGVECNDSDALTGALGRAGIYDIKVSKQGYKDGFISAVEVSSNRCTVNAVTLQVYLDKVKI